MKKGKIRALISSAVILLFLLMFMGAYPSPAGLPGDVLLYLMFLPALVKFLVGGVFLSAMGFLPVLIVTALFGRIYCGILCPLGILQDAVIHISKRIGNRKRGFFPPLSYSRYTVFFLVLLFFSAGSLLYIDLFDPLGVFGRICRHILIPLFNGVIVSLTILLEQFGDLYSFRSKTYAFSFPAYLFSAAVFLAIFLMAFKKGRLYCNAVCPVGTLLGLFSRRSLYRFRIDPLTCTHCGKCERCRASCIDSRKGKIGMDRCTSCFDCVDICPLSAIEFTRVKEDKKKPDPHARRVLLASAISGISAFFMGRLPGAPGDALALPSKETPVSPPGSKGVVRFSSMCVSCHLCIKACYSKVLRPAVLEYGIKGIYQPVLDFRYGKCAYDCNRCSQVCPSGAILPVLAEEKKRIKIGEVELLKGRCIVYEKKRDCGACAEVCPTHAVYTRVEKNIRYPETKKEVCIGCGACEEVCPVKEKAIIVKGMKVHSTAEKPFFPEKEKSNGDIFTPSDEFPF